MSEHALASDAALLALAAELDLWASAGRTVRLWLRDDDAISPGAGLDRLDIVGERFGLPVLLAVIPLLAEPALAPALRDLPSLLPCQHGCRHLNHAGVGGKKSEFGPERTIEAICAEIASARRRLDDLLGASVLPVFVPPWNRIGQDVAAALPQLGFSGLSCFRGFRLGPAGGPVVANTEIDVMDWHNGRVGRSYPALAAEIGALLAQRRNAVPTGDATLGLLLHHRDHDETAWAALETLLSVLTRHRAVAATDPRDLFSAEIAA